MTKTYTFTTTLSWGGDTPTAELEIECSYSVVWGSPETGRFGPPEDYDPGAPDLIEDIKILSVDGAPWPVDLSYGFQTAAQDHQMLVATLESACEERMLEEAGFAEAYYESESFDDRRERLRED